MRKLKVYGYPTFILMNKEGQEIERWAGFGKAKNFLAQLKTAAADPTTLAEKRARFEKAPTGEMARRIGNSLAEQNKPLEALHYFDQAIALDPKLREDKGILGQRFFQNYEGVSRGLLPFEAFQKVVDELIASQGKNKRFVRLAARLMNEVFPDEGDREQLKPYLNRALATFKKKPRRADEADQKREFEDALAGQVSLEQRLVAFEKKPEGETAFKLGCDLYYEERYTESLKMFRRAAELEPKLAEKGWFLASSSMAVREENLPAEELKKEVSAYLERNKDDTDALINAAQYLAIGLGRGQDSAFLQQYLDPALAALEKTEDEEKKTLRTDLLICRALTIEGEKEKGKVLKREALGEGWDEDPVSLTEYAGFLRAYRIGLNEAEALAQKAAEMSEPGYDRARAYATLAQIFQTQGKKAEAAAALEQAFKNSPKNKVYKRRLALLKAG